uniref:LMBR1 domain-containing protein 2 n=1 Tax=Panagrolaimus sp. PS1159 TaxID=55785 RepID=A0AC35G736_9BILA
MLSIRLHKRLIDAVQNFQRTQSQWKLTTNLAMYLEDCEQAEITQKLPHSLLIADKRIKIPENIQLLWHITGKRRLAQVTSILFAFMTVLIMWSECTFFIIHPQLSLAARILRAAALGYHYKYIQFIAVGLISYLGFCAYFTVFKLRIYKYYHLDPHHMTDENSLLFSAMLLCRLTPPICLNFLGMIHLDSHVTADTNFGVETQFTSLMGHLDVIPLIARGINIYLPILIFLLCLGTWFKLGSRFLQSLGIDQFMDDEDDYSSEMIQGGKRYVTIERNRLIREKGREERNSTFSKRFGGDSSNNSGGGLSIPKSRKDHDRIPMLQDYDDIEGGFISLHDNNIGSSSALLNSTASDSDDLDFSFATEGGFVPSQLTLAGAQRAARAQENNPSLNSNNQHHPMPSNIFDDL